MVPQVIVPVSREDVEDQTPEELLEVLADRSVGDDIGDDPGKVGVAGSVADWFAVLLPGHRHPGGVQPASRGRPVEPTRRERAAVRAQPEQGRLGHLDPGSPREARIDSSQAPGCARYVPKAI